MFKFSLRFITRSFFTAILALSLASLPVPAQDDHSTGGHTPDSLPSQTKEDSTAAVHGNDTEPHATGGAIREPHGKGGAHGKGGHGEEGEHGGGHKGGTFDPHAGTWVNPIARAISGQPAPEMVDDHGAKHIKNIESIKYDYLVIAFLIMIGMATVGMLAGKRARIRPEGKPTSIANLVEAAFEGFQNYLISIMGEHLARKYAPLIGSFFFTILFFNYMGLVPGMLAPTANPNVPIGLAIVAFIATHVIAIRETSFKAWFMHFVGEPKWLGFLNFPLHLIGELIKPISLAIRLLCNVFGEEMVVLNLAGMAVAAMAVLHLPIPFQFPIMCLGVFFGFLQAMVFSTLLSIYIAILATHHDDHGHEHVEHVHSRGHNEVVAHGSESPVA